MAGFDARFVQGELREFSEFTNGAFHRVKNAGANQASLGVYASHNEPISPVLNATFGLRLDMW